MIVYLDASALVKCYVAERGSKRTAELTAHADVVATSLISRAEVAAALAKAVRIGLLDAESAHRAHRAFASQWTDVARLPVTEAVVSRAATIAWEYGLRGYDAVHLAAALTCQESVGTAVTLATFDRELWKAAQNAGMPVWPKRLIG